MKSLRIFSVLAGLMVSCAIGRAQAPSVTIDPSRHGNLAAAQNNIVEAWGSISEAQRANDAHLGGHAGRAKELLAQANQEIQLAADQADANEANANADGPPPAATGAPAPAVVSPAPPQPANITGNWTIYAYNVNQPGSSLKQVQLSQDGNVISGYFRGPHQKGHLQGWINGSHVEFSTDTEDVLTFRGEVTPDGTMSGMYGVHGNHAPWKAQRN
ncbi:MAG TPA: hypothetical protein VGM11_04235 [Acidobacteriaceae bacterium]|jgi:hypothetical protein